MSYLLKDGHGKINMVYVGCTYCPEAPWADAEEATLEEIQEHKEFLKDQLALLEEARSNLECMNDHYHLKDLQAKGLLDDEEELDPDSISSPTLKAAVKKALTKSKRRKK